MKDKTGVDSHYGRYDFDLEGEVGHVMIASRVGHPDPDTTEGSKAEIFLLKPGCCGEDSEENIVGVIRVYGDHLVVYSDNRDTEVRTITI